MTSVAVIIPYYQKRAGILRRALDSIVSQQLPPDTQVDIILTDDGSPQPAAKETADIICPPQFTLTQLVQPNAGVGAARNTCLRNVDEQTTYIAFLDSDDMWQQGYLADAITTLDRGYDFYFCDSQRGNNPRTVFDEGSFARFLGSPYAKKIGDTVFELDKENFFDHSLRGRVFRIPAIVYRYSVAPDLTFDTALRLAGEDCLFLFQVLGRCRTFVCTTRRLVVFGEGVNIYASKLGWDNKEHLSLYMAQLLAFYSWKRNLKLSQKNRKFLDKRIANVRKLFAFLTIRYFIKHREGWTPELRALTRNDAKFWIWYPLNAIYVTLGYSLFFMRSFDKLADPTTDEPFFDQHA